MLRELAKKAKQINVKELALQVAQANAGLISERVREQLLVGENSEGQNVGKYTTKRYSSFKKRIGSIAPFGVPDLKLSGKLHKGLKAEIKPASFTVDSSVEYSKYQIKRYGKKIYGLQKENAEDVKFNNSVKIAAAYQKALGL